MGTSEFNAGDNPAMDLHPIQEGVEIFLVASCYRNRDKLWPGEPLGSYADLTFFLLHHSMLVLSLKCYLIGIYREMHVAWIELVAL